MDTNGYQWIQIASLHSPPWSSNPHDQGVLVWSFFLWVLTIQILIPFSSTYGYGKGEGVLLWDFTSDFTSDFTCERRRRRRNKYRGIVNLPPSQIPFSFFLFLSCLLLSIQFNHFIELNWMTNFFFSIMYLTSFNTIIWILPSSYWILFESMIHWNSQV